MIRIIQACILLNRCKSNYTELHRNNTEKPYIV
uniref:Uncharacterized protein n=1 Tax=Podoviridae sp. ctUSJ1 TaxID=2826558 RepID=A0A8S5NGJ2_9CAUD|nr:MAG TPA: hypothetical protein [Podoviridae sp. ctUSJ1]